MRIALVNPNILHLPGTVLSDDAAIDALVKPGAVWFREFSPNDSLLALAALTPEDHELIYMDDQFGTIDLDAQVDLAAITTVTMNADRAYELAAAFRGRGVHVVMGGIHATMLPEEAALHADTVVTGDADLVWPEFLSDLECGRPNVRYDGGYADIKKSPPPRLSILEPKHYFRRCFGLEVYDLRTSAGCSRRCRFCANWMRQGCDRIHKKSLKQVEAELARIAAFAGPRLLSVSDDNLFLDPRYAAGVARLIRDYGFTWIGSGDVSVTKRPELMRLLEESRCRVLCFGLESLDAKNMRWLAPWKARQVPRYREAISVARDHGINVWGSFIAGLEHDDLDVFQRILDFFLTSNLSSVNVAILTPYPGTEVRQRLIDEGRLDTAAPWRKYTAFNLLFRHDRFSSEQVMRKLEWFLRRLAGPEIREHLMKVTLRPQEH